MNFTTRPTVAALLLLTTLTITTAAQQKRQPPARSQTQTKPAPAPTFDTLIPSESYLIYGEIRGVGQLIKSNTFNEALEPILKLAAPPKEFKTIVKWLNAHSDEVMTSRLLVAAWPMSQEVPEVFIAIEFASAEEAAKFAAPLNQVLPLVLPPVSEPSPEDQGEKAKALASPPKPGYHLQQTGSLILLTPRPAPLKQFNPHAKPLAEDVNFRAARNRFNSEPIFVFIDLKLMERQEEERRKRDEEAQRQQAAQVKEKNTEAEEEAKKAEDAAHFEVTETVVNSEQPAEGDPPPEAPKEPAPNAALSEAVMLAASALFNVESDWPDGVGVGVSFEGDSFDVRALLVNAPGEKSDAILSVPFAMPIMPLLIPGPAIVPESPNIVPADTELFLTFSLDLPQIYSLASKPRPMFFVGSMKTDNNNEKAFETPLAPLEKELKINLKDDLLPLLGSEIAVRLPVTGLDLFGVSRARASDSKTNDNESAVRTAPVVLISLKDKEGMRALMPKLVESIGFKGASALARTERREDTELISYVNLFAYAFIGNFLVVSSDPAATRYVVDSYLKHETLATNSNFRAYTRWQPRPSQGQAYISPALMESYRSWLEQPSTRLNDQTRAFLTRMAAVAQPIAYSLSNEGFGPLHELHLPKNLVLMAIAGISGETNPTLVQRNEGSAIGLMYAIASAEHQYKKDKGAGSYATLEQLTATDMVSKEMIENSGYKFEVTLTGDKFEVSAVPKEYGKTGVMSYFMDQSMILHLADRNGAAASKSDPPIQ